MARRRPEAARPKRAPAPYRGLLAVPCSEAVWREFSSWFAARGLPAPPCPEDTCFIADARGLICGVCLYPTKGPYFIAESMATNPAVPIRLRHRALVALLGQLRSYAALRAKIPIAIIRHRSLVRILSRLGWKHQEALVMSADPIREIP